MSSNVTEAMDYAVYRDPTTLPSTGFMEIGPGKYSGKHWQRGFLFIWFDAFIIAEGILLRHFSEYDHLGMNDIPRQCGEAIVSELRSAAETLVSADEDTAFACLSLPAWINSDFGAELALHRVEMQAMLNEIASALETVYQTEGFACVLGM
jgi:hypothetical protein